MISFIQLCEILTFKQRYSWFYFPAEYFSAIEGCARDVCHVEQVDSDVLRIWYPKSKWTPSVKDLQAMLTQALDAGDFQRVATIKAQLKKCQS